MGVKAVAELARQRLADDGWYVEERPYALVLRGDPEAVPPRSDQVFVFPLGPSELNVSYPFAQTVTATLGGVVVEERGLPWLPIRVSGNFGLSPKVGRDTTQGELGPAGGRPLSGPLWTMRMLRHIFERYAALKADVEASSGVVLIWYDEREGRNWVIVPEQVDVNRTVATRGMYPFSLSFKAVADGGRVALPPDTVASIKDVVAKIKNGIRTARAGVQLVQSALDFGSEVLGEVRSTFASIDGLVDDLTRIVKATNDFLDGVTETTAVGASFITSVAEHLEAGLAVFETATSIPAELTQTYRSALDGLHLILAVGDQILTPDVDTRTAAVQARGAGLRGVSSEALLAAEAAGPPTTLAQLAATVTRNVDRALVDSGNVAQQRRLRAYAGFRPHTLTATDTLEALAARWLNDATLWADIALLNGLKYPYIARSGGEGVARPGDVVAIPVRTTAQATSTTQRGTDPEALYGRDIQLVETAYSRAGSPWVDWKIDPRTNRDVATIGGVANLKQAIQLRVWTDKGTLPLDPGYGMQDIVGQGSFASTITAAKIGLRATLLRDPRVRQVNVVRATADGDTVDLESDIVPIGTSTPVTVATALV